MRHNLIDELTVPQQLFDDTDGIRLARALKHNTTLVSLNLYKNRISDLAGLALASALKNNTTLKVLDLTHNNILYNGCSSILRMCENNSSLTKLSLKGKMRKAVSGNVLGKPGAVTCGRMLMVNTTLLHLDLSRSNQSHYEPWTMIGNNGARHICEGMMMNKTLVRLNLQYNRIGDRGAAFFAEMLKVNKTLQFLDLSGNNISKIGLDALVQSIDCNLTILKLEISSNKGRFNRRELMRIENRNNKIVSNKDAQKIACLIGHLPISILNILLGLMEMLTTYYSETNISSISEGENRYIRHPQISGDVDDSHLVTHSVIEHVKPQEPEEKKEACPAPLVSSPRDRAQRDKRAGSSDNLAKLKRSSSHEETREKKIAHLTESDKAERNKEGGDCPPKRLSHGDEKEHKERDRRSGSIGKGSAVFKSSPGQQPTTVVTAPDAEVVSPSTTPRQSTTPPLSPGSNSPSPSGREGAEPRKEAPIKEGKERSESEKEQGTTKAKSSKAVLERPSPQTKRETPKTKYAQSTGTVTWKDHDNNFTVDNSVPKFSPRSHSNKEKEKDKKEDKKEEKERTPEGERGRDKESVRDMKDSAGSERASERTSERPSKERSGSGGDKHRRGRSVGDGKKHGPQILAASHEAAARKSRGRSVSPGFPEPSNHVATHSVSGPSNVTTVISTVESNETPTAMPSSSKLTEASKPIPIKDPNTRGHHSLPERAVHLTEQDRLSLPTGPSTSPRSLARDSAFKNSGDSREMSPPHGSSPKDTQAPRAVNDRERKSSVAKQFSKLLASSLPIVFNPAHGPQAHGNSPPNHHHKPHTLCGKEDSHKDLTHSNSTKTGKAKNAPYPNRTLPVRPDSIKASVAEEEEDGLTASVYQNDSGSSIDYGPHSDEHYKDESLATDDDDSNGISNMSEAEALPIEAIDSEWTSTLTRGNMLL